ncbi:MAG: hypothetical protein L6Q73_07780 [Aquabacterium sp.]|nr:hypothetical protein [Aquabacterium sp.]
MLKSIVMHDIAMEHVAAMERWYWREHAPEINRRFGPWLVRHDSYLPVDAPPDARGAGYFNWRVTEGWWREMPEPGPRGNLAFSVPPQWPRVAAGFFAAQPTDDFVGADVQPGERQVLRWTTLSAYPAGVLPAEGERWFLETLVPQLVRAGGAWRIFSTLAHKQPLPLPGEWPAGRRPPPESVLHHWDRLTELWFETFADWRQWMREVAPTLTPPPWATQTAFPFVQPGRDFVGTFLLERPTDEFARDARGTL